MDHVGENNPNARLTEARAAEIRARSLAGERGIDLAVEFGVHPSLIVLIKAGKRWAGARHAEHIGAPRPPRRVSWQEGSE